MLPTSDDLNGNQALAITCHNVAHAVLLQLVAEAGCSSYIKVGVALLQKRPNKGLIHHLQQGGSACTNA